MPVYAIGDLQGCFDPLQRLLEKVQFDPARDQLWFTGDLVNRGPQSLECLRFVKSLGPAAVTVLGNHDLHLLAVWAGAERRKRKDTLDPVLDAPDADELCHWLRHQPMLHYDGQRDTVMTHAGLPPQWTLSRARELAAELEQVLRGPDYQAFFAHMYGNQPDTWDEHHQGYERLRLITNYLTRMRFIDAQGRLDFDSKEGPDAAPPGFRPWFEYARPDSTRILFGHWAALEGRVRNERFLALDTGCVWGGQLTALDLDSGACASCDCIGYGKE